MSSANTLHKALREHMKNMMIYFIQKSEEVKVFNVWVIL